MNKSKLINIVTLLSITIVSFVALFICINYTEMIKYIFLQSFNFIFSNLSDHKIFIFFLEMLWLFITYLVSKKNKLKWLFTFTVVAFNLIYISWRIKYTIPTVSKIGMIIGIVLIISELIGFFQSTIYSILFYKSYDLKEMKMSDLNKLPTVDILIMTYNEPSYILRKTIAGALNINYPKRLLNIYICDDGNREEIKKLAKFFNIHYITRKNNDSAKAGNINNALSNYCKGELFSVLDADMIPKPHYLEKMVGYFKENNIGFVQSPQVFYNPDPFQYNLNLDDKIPNEQDFFMREVQAGRARYNALFHVGTNALFSRKAIDEIGGIPTGSITEDMATGMILQAKGYKCLFVNKVLAVGLSAEYYKDFAKQRKRWCRGNIQVSKKWNPLIMKGLTPIQRLLYFSGILYWYSGISKMIYTLCPIIYLIFGTLIIKASTLQLLQFFVPSYISYMLIFKSHSSKYRSLILTHIYEAASAPFLALASLSELIFSKELKFNVTLKGHIKKNIFISWELLLPQLILFILTIFGYGISLSRYINSNSIGLRQSLMINIAWATYNLIAIVVAMLLSLEKPRFRKSERKIVNDKSKLLAAENKELNCVITDISDSGIEFTINRNKLGCIDVGDIVKINIDKSDAYCRILRCIDNSFGCRFINLSLEQYLNIIHYIFATENGYYDMEDKKSTYKELPSGKENLMEEENNIFIENKETKIPIMNDSIIPMTSKIENSKIASFRPKSAIQENNANKDIPDNIESYGDVSLDSILRDTLKLNEQQITILKMYNEIKELKKELKDK